jgi:Fur family ferric uptake transcriptional regulator
MHHVKGIRMTKQRRIILEELRGLRTHPTADELYERVRRRLPHISLGTIYRNLELLSRKGMIRKLEIGGSQMRFDGALGDHIHIRCMRCGRIDDLPFEAGVAECDREVQAAAGYIVKERRVEFIGICPDCIREEEDGRRF